MISMVDFVYDIQDFDKNLIKVDGNGQKGLLIVLNSKNLEEDDLSMLQKMMSAIHHDFDEDLYRLILDMEQEINISFLGLNFQKIIIFGINPNRLGFTVPFQLYKPIIFDTVWALIADDLQVIRTSPTKKQELWTCLKAKFLV